MLSDQTFYGVLASAAALGLWSSYSFSYIFRIQFCLICHILIQYHLIFLCKIDREANSGNYVPKQMFHDAGGVFLSSNCH